MKVKLDLDIQFSEEVITIQAPAMTDKVRQVINFVNNQLGKQGNNQYLTAKQGERVFLLNLDDIVRLVIENRQVQAKLTTESYRLSQPLYQVEANLPQHFLKISQSELINIHQLDHLTLTPNGLIQLHMKNGEITYSSRRYLKSIKEALGL